MSLETLLSPVTNYKNITVVFNDSIKLYQDDIQSIEIRHDITFPIIDGFIQFVDNQGAVFDNAGQATNGTNRLVIQFTDCNEHLHYYSFIIISRSFYTADKGSRTVNCKFIDEISYILQHTFISQVISGKPNEIIAQVMNLNSKTKYLFNTFLRYQNKLINYDKKISVNFTKDYSALECLYMGFKKYSVSTWIDEEGYVSGEIIPSKFKHILLDDGSQIIYSDKITNKNYQFRIHDYDIESNEAKLKERFENMPFRFDGKNIDNTTVDIGKFVQDIQLNGQGFTTYNKIKSEVNQSRLNSRNESLGFQQTELLFSLLENNVLVISVVGSYLNCIGYLANVDLKEESAFTYNQLSGDQLHSGVYLITTVIHKLSRGKLFDKVYLERFDNPVVIGPQ